MAPVLMSTEWYDIVRSLRVPRPVVLDVGHTKTSCRVCEIERKYLFHYFARDQFISDVYYRLCVT
jgi:hypothetical protein